MSWPATDFELEIQNTLDRYEAALRRIVELGEDASSSRRDLLQAFKIADEALNPPTDNAGHGPGEKPKP